MAEPALTLDIVIDQDGAARRAVAEFSESMRKAGFEAKEAAPHIGDYEKQYRAAAVSARQATDAQEKATAATRSAGAAAETAAGKKALQSRALDGLTTAALRYVGPAVIGQAILKTIQWTDEITELAERTKFTTTQVQQISVIAERSGSSFGQFATAVQQVEQRLASGKIDDELAAIGLSADELFAMNPYDRMVELSRGIHSVGHEAQRSELEMAIFGRTGDALAVTMNEIAAGADKVVAVIDEEMIAVGNEANSMWERMTHLVGAVLKETALQSVAPVVGLISLVDTLLTKVETAHDRLKSIAQLDPGQPKGWGGPGFPAPADPFTGAGTGQSYAFLNRSPRRTGRTAAPDPWRLTHPDLSLPVHWGLSGIGPGAASPFMYNTLPSLMGGAALGLSARGDAVLPGFSMASMVSPASLTGQSAWSRFSGFASGRGGQIAGGALGLLGGLIPGQSRAGAGIGSLLGSLIPGLGPLGGALGGLAGGFIGKLFGGDAKKNAANAEIGEVFKQFSTKEFIDIQREADKLGVSMEKALNAKTMKDFGAAVDEVTGKLSEMASIQSEIDFLTDATTVGFDEMNAVAKEFGLDIAALGPAFQQAALDKEAQRIIDAFAVMERGGADVNGVLAGMADEISAVVSDSLQFGTTIPENMRPWIEKLAESGQLVTASGDKITDLSQLKFGTPLKSEMQVFIDKLEELINKLAGVKDKFTDATGAAEDFADASGSADYSGPEAAGVSRGGIVGAGGKLLYFGRGGFVPRGTDSVPAMLTPGEMVIARDTVKGMARGGLSGGRAVNVTINVAGFVDSPRTADYLADVVGERLERQLEMRRAS